MAGSQKVFLRIVGLMGDGPDDDEMPDRVHVSGSGRLVPTIALGSADIAPGPDNLHEIRMIEPVPFDIVEGMLTYDGKPYVWLTVPSGEWMWRIVFDRVTVGSSRRELNDFVFPLDAATPAQIADENYPGINLAQYSIGSWAPGTVNLTAQAIQQITIYLGRASNAAAEAASTESRIAVERHHVDQVAAQVATALDQANVFAQDQVPPYLQQTALNATYADKAALGSIADEIETGRLSEAELNATYADLPTVQAVDERTTPQKMLFGLPVPKPHRAPNLAVMDVVPNPEIDVQVIRAEGDTLWALGRDNSLYKTTGSNNLWSFVAYRASGVQARGGITRCLDGSLLAFNSIFTMERSTNEGAAWTTVLPRRVTGAEPLTTQSIAVNPTNGHIFYGEYIIGDGGGKAVLWRSTDHGVTWTEFYSWPTKSVHPTDPLAISHIHGVQYDPIGQDVYVMVGDSTPATGIWKVSGASCVPVLTNGDLALGFNDSPRAIGMMFFPDYVAWGSDSTSNPHLFRIPRAAFGSDPTALERGPRLSSTAWGTTKASEDGSRWALFASDEQYPTRAADRQAHIYAVEDQGATLYEVGAISSQMTSGVTTLQPCGPAESFSDHFWFNMRTGEGGRNAAWKARLGYGGQTIPWPSRKPQHLIQSQSSGIVTVPGNGRVDFGTTRVPAFGRTLAIYDTSFQKNAGDVGHVAIQVRTDTEVLYASSSRSSRQQGRQEQGGPIATFYLPANEDVYFSINNGRATEASGFGTVTYGFIR